MLQDFAVVFRRVRLFKAVICDLGKNLGQDTQETSKG